MKFLFIYPSCDLSYPLQIGALVSFLKKNKVKTNFIFLLIKNVIDSNNLRDIKEKIENSRPDFVCFSCYETSFNWIKELSSYIKSKFPKIKIVVGGYYPTLAPEEVISFRHIDIICRGEGEFPLLELSKNPKKSDIHNLWIKKGNRLIKNSVRPLIENLDMLPFPDREMLDYQEQINAETLGQRSIKIMASRGCPFQCTYCSNKYFRELYPNKSKYLRMRSPKNVIEEVKILKKRYVFDLVGFHDDNLTLDINWLKKFSKIYKKEVSLPFYCATRVESCTEEVMDILKESGCTLLLIGVESGDQEYRKKYLKRFMSNDQITSAFKLARERGIRTWSFTMVGLPYENRKSILKTLLLNLKCRPDFVMASIFYPFRGTDLGDLCYRNDWVNLEKKEKVYSYAWDSILNHPNLSLAEIKLAKYLNSLTAIRSPLFWQLLKQRLLNLLEYGRRI